MVVNICGPLLGGAIAQGLSFRAMYMLAGDLYATAAVIDVLMARHATGTKKQKSEDVERLGFASFENSAAQDSTGYSNRQTCGRARSCRQ